MADFPHNEDVLFPIPEPAAPAAPRRPAKILPLATSRLPTEAARYQDMAKGPGSRRERSTRARPRRREPAPPAASLRPIGLPARPPGSPLFLATLSPHAHEPARPRASKFASSAVERGSHLPAEFSRSLPSSPELRTPAFRVKKGLGRATRKITRGWVVARCLPEDGR